MNTPNQVKRVIVDNMHDMHVGQVKKLDAACMSGIPHDLYDVRIDVVHGHIREFTLHFDGLGAFLKRTA